MINYTKSSDIHPCILNKEDLQDLVDLVIKDTPNYDSRGLYIRGSFGEVDIHENNLTDFLQHKNLPKTLDNLTISYSSYLKDADHRIRIAFYKSYIILDVSGSSESFVKGKYNQIKDFLKSKRPFLWFLKSKIVYGLRGVLFAVAGTVYMYLMIKWVKYGVNPNLFVSLGVVILLIIDYFISRIEFTRINISPQESFLNKHESFFKYLGVVAAIFTMIGVIYQIFHL
ncbi:MAG: hypothetical protein JWN37_403 [Candidatus Nomurabacteria bacterium]|nr:hypothetical protein [Candidatus Nomurabacteria bacterium]